MRSGTQLLIGLLLLPVLGLALVATAAEHGEGKPPAGPFVENDQIFMFLRLLTPEQMAAFYEARGFPGNALDRIRQTCFVMAHVENRGQQVLWLELKNWHFKSARGEIQRYNQDHWAAVWDEIDLPQASRSTFGWTQLPEVRDLQPGEPVGGNLVLPQTDGTFTLEANFHTGKDTRHGMINLSFNDLRCARDEVSQ